jgi:hypothetical protein
MAAAPATVAVTAEVVAPSAGTLNGVAETATVLAEAGLFVCVTVFEADWPPALSVAVILQNPMVVDGVYVVLATPLLFVVALDDPSVPQAPAGLALRVKATASLATTPPGAVTFVTVAVSAVAAAPIACGLTAPTTTVLVTAVWVSAAEPLLAENDSVAVIVQVPTVVVEVYVTAT